MQRGERRGDGVMNGLYRALRRRWPSQERRDPNSSQAGFTALELITVLAILAVVFTIVTSLFISFNQQTANTQDSVVGIQEEVQAQQTLVQYLRGASQVLAVYGSGGNQVGPSATELDAITSEGFNKTTYSSNCTNLDALWFRPPAALHADAQFDITFDVPALGPANGQATPPLPWSQLSPAVDQPTAFTPASSCTPASTTPRTVATYYALSTQTLPVFTYYYWNNSVLTPLPVQSPYVPACAINNIAAIGVHITFLDGPQVPTEGYAADQPTTLDTIVYLRGAAMASSVTTTSTTTTTTAPCPN
jgi:prepilin-type N-terminal cleavage/methylation domain-containing protein